MNEYIKFTEEEKRIARETDLVNLLIDHGETVKKTGKQYSWNEGANTVSVYKNLWFHHYEQIGGNAISFMKKFFNMNYCEAMKYLLDFNNINAEHKSICPTEYEKKAPKPFLLPRKNENMNRAFLYLMNQRGIDRRIIEEFAYAHMIYESYPYHNVVFVGYDKEGRIRHANKRGIGSESNFKGNTQSSMQEYSFHWIGGSENIFLFEAPIDLMSYITLHPQGWKKENYVAACSISDCALFKCLEDNPNINNVYICFDSDKRGQDAANRIKKKLDDMGYKSEILVPDLKDWNEDLLDFRKNGDVKWAEQQY